MERVVKDRNCRLKADAVFAAVDPVLAFVLGEFHESFVDTDLYIQFWWVGKMQLETLKIRRISFPACIRRN
jgi:hypothetical protein